MDRWIDGQTDRQIYACRPAVLGLRGLRTAISYYCSYFKDGQTYPKRFLPELNKTQ